MCAQREDPEARPAKHRNGLPRNRRLVRSEHISDAFRSRDAHRGRYLILRLRKAPDASLRLGVVAGKKSFRRAVDRARAKRMMREAFRLHQDAFQDGKYDIVLVAQPAILRATPQDMARDLVAVGRRAGIIEAPRR